MNTEPSELADLEFLVRYKRKLRSYAEFMELIIATMFPTTEKLTTDCIVRNKDLFLESSMSGFDSFRLFTVSMEQLNLVRQQLENDTLDTTKIKLLIINYFLTTSTEKLYYSDEERRDIVKLAIKMMVVILGTLLSGCYDGCGTYVVGLNKGDLVCMKLI